MLAAARADIRACTWADQHADEASRLLDILDRRAAALTRVAAATISRQAEFVLHGAAFHRPLTRTAIAHELDLAISTVSRAVAGKTVRLPDVRTLPLADFFSPAVPAKTALQQLLAEGPERSDAALAAALAQRGHLLSRRTVNKYRRQISQAPPLTAGPSPATT